MMLTDGFVKFQRKIVDWEWYKDIPVRVLFEHLIYTVNWREQQWQGKTINRGQRVASLECLAYETGLSVQQVRTALKKLEKTRRSKEPINKQI